MMNENEKSSSRKSLDKNYKALRVNVRKEKYEVWREYADSKGLSLYALVNQLFENAIEADGCVPSKKPEE